jgi:hypothetical protein
MKEKDFPIFCDLMKKLNKFFKGDINNIEDVRIYFDNLKDYKLCAVERGVNYLIAHRIYRDFPIVGHINEAIEKSRNITKSIKNL